MCAHIYIAYIVFVRILTPLSLGYSKGVPIHVNYVHINHQKKHDHTNFH